MLRENAQDTVCKKVLQSNMCNIKPFLFKKYIFAWSVNEHNIQPHGADTVLNDARTVHFFLIVYNKHMLVLKKKNGSFFFCLFGATPVAYGGSQAGGRIGTVASSLHHSHSNARFLTH